MSSFTHMKNELERSQGTNVKMLAWICLIFKLTTAHAVGIVLLQITLGGEILNFNSNKNVHSCKICPSLAMVVLSCLGK